MKTSHYILLALFATLNLVSAYEMPRGFKEIAEFDELRENAIKKKKFLTVVFKGSDDNCPRCVASIENGQKAIKSYSLFGFTRVNAHYKNETGLSEEVSSQFGQMADGAAVYFYVFDPNTLKLVTTVSRKELEGGKDELKKFKNTVREARKNL